jgi:hypothetical protein
MGQDFLANHLATIASEALLGIAMTGIDCSVESQSERKSFRKEP